MSLISSFSSISDNSASILNLGAEGKLYYGVPYLDMATGGIRRSELCVIGGRTGAGKTELGTLIAQYNAARMKNVYLFALEANKNEIETRIGFRLFSKLYYQKYKEPIYYRPFIDGEYNFKYMDLLREVETKLALNYEWLKRLYRDKEFGVMEFVAELYAIKDDADLVILDHLGHLDFDDDNEVHNVKMAIKRIRDMALLYQVPIVVIAHFRKGDRNSAQLVPDLEEFHGTSEISKVATQVITMARHEEIKSQQHINPTIFKVCKLRIDGSATRYVGIQQYNTKTNRYDNDCSIGKLTNGGKEIELLSPDKYPYWFKGNEQSISIDIDGIIKEENNDTKWF